MANKKRILVIEDDSGLRAALSALFRRAGYETTGVSVREGLVLLRSGFAADLVVADLWCETPEGEELCRALRRSGNGERLLVLSEEGAGVEGEGEDHLTDRVLHRGNLLERVSRMLR